MSRPIPLLIFWLMLFSCGTEQEKGLDHASETAKPDTIVPVQRILLADLPDSLQPKTYHLDRMPGPRVTKANAGEVKMLPVLKDSEGEPVLDRQGKPIVMGQGGISTFTTFTTDNGLALDAIGCSLMDRFGNIWFGTHGGGASRYDGKSFENFTTDQGLANNAIVCMLEDRAGNLWFGTYGGGVSKYDGRTFVNFSTDDGLASNAITSIFEDSGGNFWFGTFGSGASRYDGTSFETFTSDQGLPDNIVWSILEDRAGNLWFESDRAGVGRYDGKSFENFTSEQMKVRNAVVDILEDRDGKLWFGTNGGGVSMYDGKSFKAFTTAHGLAHNMVRNILEDHAGNLWFSTLGGGVSKYDGESFVSFTTDQGLANNTVRTIVEDRGRNLWFGTYGGGVSKYAGGSFVNFTTAQGLANHTVWSIEEDRAGNLWFGTNGGGVSRYDGTSFTNFTKDQGLTNHTIWSILEDREGNIWFGTDGHGAIQYDGKTFDGFSTDQGLAHNGIWSILEDRNGNLWFGTNGGGVSRYDGNSFLNFTTDQGLANNTVWSILEDKAGDLWFGTNGGGLSRYDGTSIQTFTTAHGLSDNTVWSTFEDRSGNLWFGTANGLNVLFADDLSRFSGQEGNMVEASSTLFKSFSTRDGLADNLVTQVIQLPDGKMAVGSNLGITLFNLSEDHARLVDIEMFNSVVGHPLKDVNVGQNAMFLDSKGIIWAGTSSEKTALVRFDHGALRKNMRPPALVIRSVKVKDENICWYDLQTKGVRKDKADSTAALLHQHLAYGKTLSTSENDSILKRFGNIQFDSIAPYYPVPHNLVLPYRHNQVSFDFTAIETDRPSMVKYQYMLEGYDSDWRPVTQQSHANFGNINEGTYTFKLKAQGGNGVWTDPVIYTFEVLPPLYRTWWAYLTYFLLFLLFLRTFSKWRERNLIAAKEQLERTVEERTEEVVREKKKSDDLLLNILPEEVAEELKDKGHSDAQLIDQVTVLFTDFKGFTALSEKVTPKELVADLHECFSAFDNICEKYGIEKIKTIGDAYMAAGGLPSPNTTHAQDVVNAALEMAQVIEKGKMKKVEQGLPYFEIRIGVHTGPVVAGIVGVKKFQYDIWGDTVNTASRMESSGEVGKVNVSQTTYELVKDQFTCEYRGEVEAKGKGKLKMYFVST